jgi:hypothetical protein
MADGPHRLMRRQRDAVRETVIWNLASACTDFEMSLVQREDYKHARRLRREIEDAAALLDHLGWEFQDLRESFELALPRKQLRRIAKRLKQSAANELFAHAIGLLKGLDEDEQYDRAVIVGRVCLEILDGEGPLMRPARGSHCGRGY